MKAWERGYTPENLKMLRRIGGLTQADVGKITKTKSIYAVSRWEAPVGTEGHSDMPLSKWISLLSHIEETCGKRRAQARYGAGKIKECEEAREAFERYVFAKNDLDYSNEDERDIYFRRRKGKYLNDDFEKQLEIWTAGAEWSLQARWRDSAEEVPEKDCSVLVSDGRRVWKSDYIHLEGADGACFLNVPPNLRRVFWMPLPALPPKK